MRFVVTVALLTLPGALAAFLHRRLTGRPMGFKQLAAFTGYALFINGAPLRV